MKKSILLMAFSFILFTACSTQDAIDQIEEESSDVVYVLKQANGASNWEAMEVDLSQSNSLNNRDFSRGQSEHAHGDYTGFGGSTTISFSGTENNGGAHGSAEVHRTFGPFEAHYILETTSVVVDGNEAIYGGIITEVIVNTFPLPPPPPPCPTFPNCPPPPSCNPNDVGNYVYFKVLDSGQGSNASPDKYQGLFQSCNIFSDGAASFPWFIFGSPNDVENASDNIKVN
jgi:hypothetical protein|tara:strand:+ start:7197 stop:7883 length:687 start_codon:yes stop_codon:yes gene_type:complete